MPGGDQTLEGGASRVKKWHLIIDVEKCENCNNCFLACKDEFCGNGWPGYSASQPLHGQRWMNILRKERGQFPTIDVAYLPSPCMHCGEAPCLRSAKNGAVTRRPDGIVLIDPERGRGQKALLKACPYGAIWWNEEKNLPQKCTLCAHLLDEGWKAPRCVQACPTGALSIVKLDDGAMQRLIEAQSLELLGGASNPTRPTVYYKNLYRFKKCFIAGTVATGRDQGQEECLQGAAVKLFKEGRLLEDGVTDAFGDFKFDRLQDNSGFYDLEISHPVKGAKQIQIELKQSVSVGTVWI
jgi:Fe-S-cluster-containing dehydrogenase component